MEVYKGKVVWIIGASSGFGEALAYALSDLGAKLILSARREELLDRIKEKASNAVSLPLDLEERDSFQQKTNQAISIFGEIDYVIYNAGIAQRGTSVDTSPEVERKIMQVNYFGFTELNRCILPYFIEQKFGHIVVVSGLLAMIWLPGRSSYAASKAALLAYFGCLRAEQTKNNIYVSLLIPGAMQTELVNKAMGKNGALAEANAPTIGYPVDLAAQQALRAIAKGSFQSYIGAKDKAYFMMKINSLFPNFITDQILKRMG